MKTILKCSNAVFLMITFFLVGCIPALDNKSKQTAETPTSFFNQTDTNSFKQIDYSEFFQDQFLVNLIDTALQNNFDLLMTIQKIEAARANILLAKGDLIPTLDAGIIYNQRKFGLYTMDGAGNITTDITPGQIIPIHLQDYYIGFQTSWEVDMWGKLRNKKRASLERYLATVESAYLVQTTLVSEIALAYYYLIALDLKTDVLEQTIANQEKALEMIKTQKLAAGANELAVLQFEAQLTATKILHLENKRESNNCENRINFLLGRYPQKIEHNKESLKQDLPESIQTGIPSDLLVNRPDIKMAEFELLATDADLKAARAAFYPSFTISGLVGFQAFNPSYLFISPESVVYGLLGNLSAPLVNRNAIKADFYSANASQIEALYNYQSTILQAYVEVNNEIFNLKNMQAIMELKNRERDIANTSLEIANELFATGKANYLEVLMVQQSMLETNLEWIDQKANQHYTLINLYKALGGGWR